MSRRTKIERAPGGRIVLEAVSGGWSLKLGQNEVRELRELLMKPGACSRCGGECPCSWNTGKGVGR